MSDEFKGIIRIHKSRGGTWKTVTEFRNQNQDKQEDPNTAITYLLGEIAKGKMELPHFPAFLPRQPLESTTFESGTATTNMAAENITGAEVVAKIKEITQEFESRYGKPINCHHDSWGPRTLLGMNVVEDPALNPKPRMTLAANVPVTEEFREEINKWMIEFFGLEPERIYLIAHNTVVLSPKSAALIKVTT